MKTTILLLCLVIAGCSSNTRDDIHSTRVKIVEEYKKILAATNEQIIISRDIQYEMEQLIAELEDMTEIADPKDVSIDNN